jgi:hypothetical protein
LDLTAELPVFAVALAGVAAFLLGVGTRRATTRTGCARCRSTAARHARRTERPAFLGFPGHHAGQLPFDYGDHLDPTWLEDDVARLPQRIPTPPTDAEVREWILTDRCIDTLCGDHGWTVDALPWPPVHPRSIFASPVSAARLALTAPVRDPATRPMEALSG